MLFFFPLGVVDSYIMVHYHQNKQCYPQYVGKSCQLHISNHSWNTKYSNCYQMLNWPLLYHITLMVYISVGKHISQTSNLYHIYKIISGATVAFWVTSQKATMAPRLGLFRLIKLQLWNFFVIKVATFLFARNLKMLPPFMFVYHSKFALISQVLKDQNNNIQTAYTTYRHFLESQNLKTWLKSDTTPKKNDPLQESHA